MLEAAVHQVLAFWDAADVMVAFENEDEDSSLCELHGERHADGAAADHDHLTARRTLGSHRGQLGGADPIPQRTLRVAGAEPVRNPGIWRSGASVHSH